MIEKQKRNDITTNLSYISETLLLIINSIKDITELIGNNRQYLSLVIRIRTGNWTDHYVVF